MRLDEQAVKMLDSTGDFYLYRLVLCLCLDVGSRGGDTCDGLACGIDRIDGELSIERNLGGCIEVDNQVFDGDIVQVFVVPVVNGVGVGNLRLSESWRGA